MNQFTRTKIHPNNSKQQRINQSIKIMIKLIQLDEKLLLNSWTEGNRIIFVKTLLQNYSSTQREIHNAFFSVWIYMIESCPCYH